MVKRILSILTIVLYISSGYLCAQEVAQEQNSRRPKIGLVLSGGGAKGSAHLGILRALDELDIPVDIVVGTSMGALMGGFYSMGYSAEEIETILKGMDWERYMSNDIDRESKSTFVKNIKEAYLINIPFDLNVKSDKESRERGIKQNFFANSLPGGYLSGQHVLTLFNFLSVGYQERMNFKDLPIEYACVAVDMQSREEVVLTEGVLPLAMRASMAIPGVFNPVNYEGRVLVDGGLKNNFPVDVCKKMGADIIIGCNLQSPPTEISQESIVGLIKNLFLVVTDNKRDENKKLCDIYLEPDISGYGMLSFDSSSIDTIINRGVSCVNRHYAELEKLKSYIDSFPKDIDKTIHPKAHNLMGESLNISEVNFNGISERDERWLIRKCKISIDEPITQDRLNEIIAIMNGMDCYKSIVPRIEGNMEPYTLVFDIEQKEPNAIRVGLNINSDQVVSLLLEGKINAHRFNKPRIGIKGRLSASPYARLEFDIPTYYAPRIGLNVGIKSQSYTVQTGKSSTQLLDYDLFDTELYIAESRSKYISTRLGVKYNNYMKKSWITTSTNSHIRTVSLSGNFTFDTRNSLYFTSKGMCFSFGGDWVFAQIDSPNKYGSAYFDIMGAIPLGKRVALLPYLNARSIFGEQDNPYYNNVIGGYIEGYYINMQRPFVGLTNSVQLPNNYAQVRLDTRVNVWKKLYVSAQLNYNCSFDSFNDLGWDKLRHYWGAGLEVAWDTNMGPLSVNVHYSNIFNSVGTFVNLGYYF